MLAILIIIAAAQRHGGVFMGLWITGIELKISAMMGMTWWRHRHGDRDLLISPNMSCLSSREGKSHDEAVSARWRHRFGRLP